jgi:sucrose phosphorylase
LNITLFDALSDPQSEEPVERQIDRFIASQAIMLAMVGVPGIYVHSLFGSSNDHVGLKETGRARTINRQKWLRGEVEAVMANPNSRSYRVFQRYVALLKARAGHRAFHPNGDQQVMPTGPALFGLLRIAPDGSEQVLCLHNISAQPQSIDLDLQSLSLPAQLQDILSEEKVRLEDERLRLRLKPYEVRWLRGT